MARRCCCCVGLRAGTVLVGVLFLLADAGTLLWAALGAAGNIDPWTAGFRHVFDATTLRRTLFVSVAVSAVSVLGDLLLLVAAGRQRRAGLLAWLVWTGLRLAVLTLALLTLLALALWLQFDRTAMDRLGWQRDSGRRLIDDVPLSSEQRDWAYQHEFVLLAVLAGVGLLLSGVLWAWLAAVRAYSRRLRHASVIVHRSRTHTNGRL